MSNPIPPNTTYPDGEEIMVPPTNLEPLELPLIGQLVDLPPNSEATGQATILNVSGYQGDGWFITPCSLINGRNVLLDSKLSNGTWITRNHVNITFPDKEGVEKCL